MSLPMFASVVGIGLGVLAFVAYHVFNNQHRAQTYANNATTPDYSSQSAATNSARRRRPPDNSEKNDCMICLEGFADSKPESFTHCLHRFHTECLNHWRRYSMFCPICRSNL